MALPDLTAPSTSPPSRAIRRYHIAEKIGSGGMGVVYRAHDLLTGQAVALKQLAVPRPVQGISGFADTPYQLATAQEFRILAALRHPYIISVLDYGFDADRSPFLTMELLEGAQDIRSAASGSLSDRIKLLVQVLQALIYLHQHGIIHRDLKPSNLLVRPDGQVKVLDFGLALQGEQPGHTVGTAAYMAPEIIREEAVTLASDLFSLGVIAYEMLAGRHPFEADSAMMLSYNILFAQPDRAPIAGAQGGGPALVDWMETALAKDPTARFATARAMLAALCAAADYPLPAETLEIRDSFLQAAPFTGRADELRTLTGALRSAQRGRGGGWLLSGESGVGKSRLLDELRIRALAQGVPVWRGQAAREQTDAYDLWLPVLRHACLHTDLNDLELGVLKGLIPDIAALMQRPAGDAPALDAQAAQERLRTVIVEVFRRQDQPVLVLLEDLQWASADSMAILKAVSEVAASGPLLLVGSYRDDESPYLYGRLPQMQHLGLSRLSTQEIAALSVAMLGEASVLSDLVRLLWQQTEGNVFFLVEVLRTLADSAGRLEQVAQIAPPEFLFAARVTDIIQRRINRLRPDALPLLHLAAVLGRNLDSRLLEHAAGPRADPLDYLDWMMHCSDAALLTVENGTWRFAHDKVRECILHGLDNDQVRALNRQAAQTIEAVYPDQADMAASLAQHWSAAGDLARTAQYYTLAGEHMLRQGALESARRILERALALEAMVSIPPPQRVRVRFALMDALRGLNHMVEAVPLGEEAWSLLGMPIPAPGWRLHRRLVREIVEQFIHFRRPGLIPVRATDLWLTAEHGRSLAALGETYGWLGQFDRLFYVVLRGLNTGERLRSTDSRMIGYMVLGYMLSLLPRRGQSAAYRATALDLLPLAQDAGNIALVLQFEALLAIGAGQWADAEAAIQRCLSLREQSGDLQGELLARLLTAGVFSFSPDEAEYSRRLDALEQRAERLGSPQYIGWACTMRGERSLQRGALDEAFSRLQRAADTIRVTQDGQPHLYVAGMMALCCLKRGDEVEARRWADRHLERAARTGVIGYGAVGGHAAAAEVVLTLLERSHNPAERAALRLSAEAALRLLRHHARLFAIGRPFYGMWQGVYDWMQGRHERARRLWSQALTEAQALDMVYLARDIHTQSERHEHKGA